MSAKVRDEVRGDIILTATDLQVGRELAKAYRWYWGTHLPDDDAAEPARVGWAAIAREVSAVMGADLLDRNAALERDRALLLRYVRAQHAYGRALIARGEPFPEDWEPFPGSIAERAAAWDAIRDAGLLEGADDGE